MINKEVLLTEGGYRKLKQELDYLIRTKRNEVAERLSEARSFGDVNENTEYADAKYEQEQVEERITSLGSQLNNANIIDLSAVDTKTVALGSRVSLEIVGQGRKVRFTVVGSAEADPAEGLISDESPMGRALLGAKRGETVTVEAPRGLVEYRVVRITKP